MRDRDDMEKEVAALRERMAKGIAARKAAGNAAAARLRLHRLRMDEQEKKLTEGSNRPADVRWRHS